MALPAFLQKREATLAKVNPGGLPSKLVRTGQQNGVAPRADRLAGHALPGADGKTLPLVNGKPVLNGQNLPMDGYGKHKQGVAAANAAAIANGGTPATNGQGKGAKFRKRPAGGATSGQEAQQKLKANDPTALKGQIAANGKLKSFTVKVGAARIRRTGPSTDKARGPSSTRRRWIGGPAGDKVLSGNPHRQVKQQAQVLSKPQKPEFHAAQMRRQPPVQQNAGKRPPCGHPNEPACQE